MLKRLMLLAACCGLMAAQPTLGAVAIANVGTEASGAGSAAVSAPSGSGGILAMCVIHSATTAFTTPTNWNARATITQANGARVAWFDRVSDGGSDDSPTVSAASGTTTLKAVILRLSGTPTSSYYDSSAAVTVKDDSIDGTGDIPTFTVANNDSLQLVGIWNSGNTGMTYTFNSPVTEQAAFSLTSSPRGTMAYASRNAGSVSADTFTMSTAGRKAVASIVYLPDTVGGGNGLVYPQIIGSLIRPTPWSRFIAHTPIALEAR